MFVNLYYYISGLKLNPPNGYQRHLAEFTRNKEHPKKISVKMLIGLNKYRSASNRIFVKLVVFATLYRDFYASDSDS